jgi:hypothetical protein
LDLAMELRLDDSDATPKRRLTLSADQESCTHKKTVRPLAAAWLRPEAAQSKCN